jgi:YesN/AraC family two-component response regulator
MPVLLGTDLAIQVRQVRATIPVILMSGFVGPQLAQRAAAIGVNEVLRKPLLRQDLAESLARVLGAVDEHPSRRSP